MAQKSDKKISHLTRLDFNENPNLGVFCRSNNDVAFVRRGLTKKVTDKVSSVLKVDLVELSISDSNLVGSLLCLNSSGAVLTDFTDRRALDLISNQDLDVCVIEDKYNAVGNDILVNDYGALVHPEFSDESIEKIKQVFDVPVYRGTIASLKTVGMAAVVTNKGCLCHPKVSDEEKDVLKDVFDVDVMIGTVNHGSPVIGSGLAANNKGAVIGRFTTGIEMGRIEEALGFLK
ncbi:MAG: translation initiation factor IF-6 [Candidatus Thermoplasmatota archaeon]